MVKKTANVPAMIMRSCIHDDLTYACDVAIQFSLVFCLVVLCAFFVCCLFFVFFCFVVLTLSLCVVPCLQDIILLPDVDVRIRAPRLLISLRDFLRPLGTTRYTCTIRGRPLIEGSA